MDPANQQKEQTRYFTELEHDSSKDLNFYDFKGSQNSFLPQQNLGCDPNFAVYSKFDRNMGLQVVPSFDDEVFADASFSHIDYEHTAIHQNQSGTNYQSEENPGKLGESLACLSEEGEIGKDIDGISKIKTEANEATGPEERRQSDTDSLDVYLKPCVITPTKVEDLYSTLQGENNIIFQFPPDKEIPTCSESTLQQAANQQYERLNDSNVFEIQLCSLSHEALYTESCDDRNLNSYHSNDLLAQKFNCCSNTNMNMRLSHCLTSAHSERRIHTNNDSPTDIPSILSKNITELQEPSEHSESRSLNSSSFPPFLVELSSQRIFPPKPANIFQNVSNGSIALNFDKKEYLHMHHKDTKNESIKEELQPISTVINVFQKKDSKTIPYHVQNQRPTTTVINDEEQAEPRKFDTNNLKRLSSYSKTLNKESSAITFKKNYSESDVEMSSEVTRGQTYHIRMIHNDTEKQRRDQMKTRFESLRQVIPKIERIERTPKIQILKQAWKCIRCLEDEGRKLEIIKTEEKEKNKRLLKKLQNIVKILKEGPHPAM